MEQLKMMKQSLVACVQGQMGRLNEIDAKELGEVVDMIKDLSEAIYYCTVTEAMEGKEKEGKERVYYIEPHYTRDMDRPMGRMYYDEYNYNRYYDKYTDGRSEGGRDNRNYMEYANGQGGGGGNQGGGNRNFQEYANGGQGGRGGSSSSSGGNRNFYEKEMPIELRDYREGRSPQSRRMYMEAKEMKMDKATSMKELEKYVQELTHDMVEMVADASPEEKQYLERRVSALASKIGQTANA